MKWTKVLLLWGAIALLYGFQSYLFYRLQGIRCSFGGTLLDQLPNFLLWGFYTPLIFRLGQAFPVGPGRWANIWKVHAPAAVTIGIVHALLISYIRWQFYIYPGESDYLTFLSGFFQQWFFFQLLLYAAILLVFYLLEKDKAYHQQQYETLRLEKTLAATRLEALKAQLHPHYLFKALYTVSMFIRTDEPQKANKTLTRLSGLLRHVLDQRDTHWHTLEREMAWIAQYLEIEQERFSDRFRYDIQVDPVVAQVPIPDMLLQPLVENALKHGLQVGQANATLHIRAYAENGTTVIKVADNGKGFNGATTEQGLGIRNVRERLATVYAGQADLTLLPDKCSGTIALIKIPRNYATESNHYRG